MEHFRRFAEKSPSGHAQLSADLDIVVCACSTDSAAVAHAVDTPRSRFGEIFLLVVAVVLGAGTVLPIWTHMYGVWISDPLRSVGACFPAISLAGVLLAWRGLQWRTQGRWHGLLLIIASGLLARFFLLQNPILAVDNSRFSLAPWGIALFLYGVGAVVLIGGISLLRAALGTLCLLLAVNPVPTWYNTLVDLPLQQLSAASARGFAHIIGLQPTGEQLRMMFAPNFGMMIVPGCNGVRGSITFAYIALIFGYFRSLRPRTLASITLLAFLTGYLLNLLRLCLLVLYYRLGISVTTIRSHGISVDYAIGGSLFFLATFGLGILIRSLEQVPHSDRAAGAESRSSERASSLSVVSRAVLLLLTAGVFVNVQARPLTQEFRRPLSEETINKLFPTQVGSYRLVRTHGEQFAGQLALALGDYESPGSSSDSPSKLTFGIWLAGPSHSVTNSKRAQGTHPLWTGGFEASRIDRRTVRFYSTIFDEGWARQFNAEADCTVHNCAPKLATDRGIRLELVHASWKELVRVEDKRLPILLRREVSGATSSDDNEIRDSFERDVSEFVRSLNLETLVEAAGSRS